MGPVICECAFSNPTAAKFCGKCAKSLGSQSRRCRICGHEAQQDVTFCQNCGTPLEDRSPVAPPPVSTSSASEAVGKKIRCSNCGFEGSGDTPICQNCGGPMENRSSGTNPPGSDSSVSRTSRNRNQRLIGIVTGVEGSLRLLPNASLGKSVEIVIPTFRAVRVAKLVHVGDELEVIGDIRLDGTLRPVRIVNERTDVLVFGPHTIRGCHRSGTVTALADHSIEVSAKNSGDVSAKLLFPSSKAFARVSKLLHLGDEVEVTGTLNRSGSLEPSRIWMLRTGELVYGRSALTWVLNIITAVVLVTAISITLNARNYDSLAGAIGVYAVIFSVIVRVVVWKRNRRKKKRLAQ